MQPLYREFPIQKTDRYFAMFGFQTTVYDQEISIIEPRADHRFSANPCIEGGLFILDQRSVKTDPFFLKIIRWGRKSCRNGIVGYGNTLFLFLVWRKKSERFGMHRFFR